jgi:hypothetical protein
VPDPGRVVDRLPAGLPEARELEVVPLPRHPGNDAPDAGPAAEVLADAGDRRRLSARRVGLCTERSPALFGGCGGYDSRRSPRVSAPWDARAALAARPASRPSEWQFNAPTRPTGSRRTPV